MTLEKKFFGDLDIGDEFASALGAEKTFVKTSGQERCYRHCRDCGQPLVVNATERDYDNKMPLYHFCDDEAVWV